MDFTDDMSTEELLFALENKLAANTDPRKKEIGDLIRVWDGSGLADINDNDVYIIYEPFISGKFIVVETGCTDVYKSKFGYFELVRDLIIADINTKICYKTSSQCVQLI